MPTLEEITGVTRNVRTGRIEEPEIKRWLFVYAGTCNVCGGAMVWFKNFGENCGESAWCPSCDNMIEPMHNQNIINPIHNCSIRDTANNKKYDVRCPGCGNRYCSLYKDTVYLCPCTGSGTYFIGGSQASMDGYKSALLTCRCGYHWMPNTNSACPNCGAYATDSDIARTSTYLTKLASILEAKRNKELELFKDSGKLQNDLRAMARAKLHVQGIVGIAQSLSPIYGSNRDTMRNEISGLIECSKNWGQILSKIETRVKNTIGRKK